MKKLDGWIISKTQRGHYFLRGYSIETDEYLRQSSNIVNYDKETMVATTRSGSKYELSKESLVNNAYGQKPELIKDFGYDADGNDTILN